MSTNVFAKLQRNLNKEGSLPRKPILRKLGQSMKGKELHSDGIRVTHMSNEEWRLMLYTEAADSYRKSVTGTVRITFQGH